MEMSAIKKIKIGDRIMVTDHFKGAVSYKVTKIESPLLTVREKEGYRAQMVDISQVTKIIKSA